MARVLLATSAITLLVLSVLAAPVPENDGEHPSAIEPLLVPETSKKFAEIFKYSLEICGTFNSHQANELKDAILMLTDALESFPKVQDNERTLLEATAATIARTVAENATKDGGIFTKISCVDQALKMAFKLTTGKPDHSFILEVQRMIEVFFFQDNQPGDSSYSYEGSNSSFYDEDDSDDGDYLEDGDYGEYFESPENYEDNASTGYFENPVEMEYFEGMEPNPENGFLREEYDPYGNMGDRTFIEVPEFLELVPVEFVVMEVPEEYY